MRSIHQLLSNWELRTGNFESQVLYLNLQMTQDSPGGGTGTGVTVVGQLTQGAHETTFYPVLTVTTGDLPGAGVGTAYQTAMEASAGASRGGSKTDPTLCGGNCGSFPAAGLIVKRSGAVNGSFIVSTVTRASGVSTFTPKQTIVGGTW
jgi:hypothetical protein